MTDMAEWLAHVKAVSQHNCCSPQLQYVRLQDEFTLPAALVYSPQRTLVLRCPRTSSVCCQVGAVCAPTVHSCIFRPFSVRQSHNIWTRPTEVDKLAAAFKHNNHNHSLIINLGLTILHKEWPVVYNSNKNGVLPVETPTRATPEGVPREIFGDLILPRK